MTSQELPFSQIWLVDFEFRSQPGGRPETLCMVAREYHSGRVLRLWADGLYLLREPPFSVSGNSLFVAYYASAEFGCFLDLDWPMPSRVLDLYAEFRNLTNGRAVPSGNGLLGALAWFGLDAMAGVEKAEMRRLALRGGSYSGAERQALLDYCQADVDSLQKLLGAMAGAIDWPRALLRGRYMVAAARVEWAGVPIDVQVLTLLRDNWGAIKGRLIQEIDSDYRVFAPTNGRRLNPETAYGSTMLSEAAAFGVEPSLFAEAVDVVWRMQKTSREELCEGLEAARRATGLNRRRINQWEDSGKDYSSYPGLDDVARELAGQCPALGLGPGFALAGGVDETNYAEPLWELLRDGPGKPTRTDPETLRQAEQFLSANYDPAGDYEIQRSFSVQRFEGFLSRNGIPWPRLESGALDLKDGTFRQMAKLYPSLAPLRELRSSLSQLRLHDLTVGADGRNRCLLSAFSSKTGRNQPSNSKFIFGPSVWSRGLIKPEPGYAVAYVDWEQQEFGIAAALSGDRAMQAAYRSGDPYLAFAKQAGAVPENATKESHPNEREMFKVCALAVQYGAGENYLSGALGVSIAHARNLLKLHHETYQRFWTWLQAAIDTAMLHGELHTVFGWTLHVGPETNARTLSNFPMQANGAEMLRLACCLATERGIEVCAPVHDALLVWGPETRIESVVQDTADAMREASEIVLGGFGLGTDAKIVRCSERYSDRRGEKMWEVVTKILCSVVQDIDIRPEVKAEETECPF